LKRVQPEAAIISDGAWNRYGHPAQSLLDRLKAANVKVYRTDLQGEITITTKGKADAPRFYEIKPAKETTEDVWAGREGQKDDASRSGLSRTEVLGRRPNRRVRKRKKNESSGSAGGG